MTAWRLTPRQLSDLELLATGAFAPLSGFLGRSDYEAVVDRMRLADGTLWPVPVVLDLPGAVVRELRRAPRLSLVGSTGRTLATLQVEEAWRPDRVAEAAQVLATTDEAHPGVTRLVHETNPWYVGGSLVVHERPLPLSLGAPVLTPDEMRAEFARRGWTRVVAFNTRNPMHNAHRALVLRAADATGANILIHPVVGPTKAGDLPAPVRVRCYQAVIGTLPPGRAMLSLLPLAMRMAGPREALWHALIRRNYGVSAFVVGRDHAGPGRDRHGRPFYGADEAQKLVRAHEGELGIEVVTQPELFFVPGQGYLAKEEIPPDQTALSISGSRLRALLDAGADIPEWLAPREVVAELTRSA